MAKEEEKTPKIAKARYWWAVLYQENMRPDWRETIDDLLQLPYAYCEHTADKDSKSEHRKDHVHIIVAKSNTTSYKHIMEVFNLLSAPGKKALKFIGEMKQRWSIPTCAAEALRQRAKRRWR